MEELQTFKDQLALVNLQLEGDPDNEGLLTLKAEFLELIELTEAAAKAEASKNKGKGREREKERESAKESTASASNTNWEEQGEYRAGMDCMAKYHRDGKWYPARINAVMGSKESPLYTITFKGYTSSTNVPLSSLRPHDPTAPIPKPVVKRPNDQLTEREKEKKKKKGEKWLETQKARTDDAKGKQNAWQKFGKKASKKGIHIAGLEGTSVFRTSESPVGRVGVVNSGKGFTSYERMGKHKFERSGEE